MRVIWLILGDAVDRKDRLDQIIDVAFDELGAHAGEGVWEDLWGWEEAGEGEMG